MSIPFDRVYGTGVNRLYGLMAVGDDLIQGFPQFLLLNGYATTQSRANQIRTQAREYYYQDTGTATARPHSAAVNDYAAYYVETAYQRIPFFVGLDDVEEWNSSIFPNELRYKGGLAGTDIDLVIQELQDLGLAELSVIVGLEPVFVPHVLDKSP